MPPRIEPRKIHEIVGRYRLEPTLANDIFVEGFQDQLLLTWYLEAIGEISRKVYPIESIEVPEEVMLRHNLERGSRRREVIAFAAELGAAGALSEETVLIVDRDLDDALEPVPVWAGVCLTDVGAMDVYLLHSDAAEKLRAFIGRKGMAADEIVRSVLGVAKQLYEIRAAIHVTDIGVKILDPTPNLVLGAALEFNSDEYLQRVMQNGPHYRRLEEVRENLRAVQQRVRARGLGALVTVHGHDALLILAWFLRRLGARADLRAEENLRSMLQMALTVPALREWPLFSRLSPK